MSEPKNLRHYAHVRDGLVVNVTVWDGVSKVTRPDDIEVVPLPYVTDEDGTIRYKAGIGWTYNPKATKNKWVDNRPVEEEATDGGD